MALVQPPAEPRPGPTKTERILRRKTGQTSSGPTLPFGLNTLLGAHDAAGNRLWGPEDVGRASADMRPGALVRWVVEWQQIQPNCAPASTPLLCDEPGPMNWGLLDEQLAKLSAHQVKLLPVVMAAPRWAWGPFDVSNPNRPRPLMPPGDDEQSLGWWGEFVAQLVERIETRHPGLLAGVEIWNEQNSPVFWTHALGPDPARYAGVLCAASEAVAAVDPALPVLFGGVGESRPGDRETTPLGQYVDAAYKARDEGGPDITQCMTSLGVHPYGHGVAPSDPNGGFLRALDSAREAIAANNDVGRRLSITEFGFPSDGPNGELRQGEWNMSGYRIAAGIDQIPGQSMADIDMMIIHTLYDAQGAGGDTTESGVCRAPGDPKPIANDFKRLFTGQSRAAC